MLQTTPSDSHVQTYCGPVGEVVSYVSCEVGVHPRVLQLVRQLSIPDGVESIRDIKERDSHSVSCLIQVRQGSF